MLNDIVSLLGEAIEKEIIDLDDIRSIFSSLSGYIIDLETELSELKQRVETLENSGE